MTPTQKGLAAALFPLLAVLGFCGWYVSPPGRTYRLQKSDLVALSNETERNPNDGLAWYYFGSRLRTKGAQTEAIGALQRSLELRPNDNRVRVELGWALLDSNETELAFQLAKAATNTEPKSVAPKALLGRLYQRTGAYHKAEEQWREVVRQEPRDDRAWYFLAFCYLQMQRVDKAQEAADRALAEEPGHPPYLRLRASIASAIGDLSGARAYYERAIERDPNDARSYHDLANFLLAQKASEDDGAAAQQAVEKLSTLDPANPLLPWHRARILVLKGDWRAAIPALQSVVRSIPNLPEADFQLATAYYRTGNKASGDAAMARYRKRSELNRRIDELRIRREEIAVNAELQFQLAALELQAGLLEEAEQTALRGLQLEPGNAYGSKLLTAIREARRERRP